ncbi:MAG: hypothetical protein ACOVK2_03345 [Candidatus Fonsibacter sp.]|jgi:hypothetical protein
MTEDQVERIAELVFQKLIKKQEEWDQQFNKDIYTELEISDSVNIATQLAVAEMLLKQYIEIEDYVLAGEIQKTIILLNDRLKERK